MYERHERNPQFQTKVGTFQIRPDAAPVGGFELRIVHDGGDRERLGHYANLTLAAGDVFSQATGFHKWDSLASLAVSREIENIAEWHCSASRA